MEAVVEDAPQAPKRGAGAGWAVVEWAAPLGTVDAVAPPAMPGNSVDAARFLLPFNPPKLEIGFAVGAVVVVTMVTAGLAPNTPLAPVLPKRGLKVGTVGLLSWAGGGAVEVGGEAMKMGLKPDARRGLAVIPAADTAPDAVGSVYAGGAEAGGTAAVPNRLVPDMMGEAMAVGLVAWFSTWVKAEGAMLLLLLLGCPSTMEADWGSWEELNEGGGFCG